MYLIAQKAGIWATEKWRIRINEIKKLFLFSECKIFPFSLVYYHKIRTTQTISGQQSSFYSCIYKQRLPFVPDGSTQMMKHLSTAMLISYSVYQHFH